MRIGSAQTSQLVGLFHSHMLGMAQMRLIAFFGALARLRPHNAVASTTGNTKAVSCVTSIYS